MVRRISMTGVVVVLAFAVGGCDVPPAPEPGPVSSPTVAPVGGPVTLHVQLLAGQTLTMGSPADDKCPGLDARIDLGSRRAVRLVAYATSCKAGDNVRPGNGRHGVFRTTADIPAERRADAIGLDLPLGSASAFSQPYYECTNSCKNFTEPVVVITLANPSDPEFPTLTVYSDKGTVGLDPLCTLVRDQLLA